MIATLKRRLRPLKPVLGPIWRQVLRLRELGDRVAVRSQRRAAERADAERRRAGLPEPPIRAMRPHEIVDLAAAVPYYRARTVYMRAAGAIADELIARHGLTSALELGPHRQPLILGADVMDVRPSPDLHTTGRLFAVDATKAPWPFPDRAYDLFVALQVFEHLGTRQPDAFREVRRVARHAILSLPIDWEMDDPRNCHHHVRHEQVLGWFAPVVPSRVVQGNGGRRKRLLYVFENLPRPDPEPPSSSVVPDELPSPAPATATD
jgi:hypothetical protein